MSIAHPSRLRIAGSVLVAGLLMGGASPTFAQALPARASCDQPVLDLANPSPGDMLIAGGYSIQGTAFDPRAMQASGIDHVSIFLDAREAGGIDLGEATPGVAGMGQTATPAMNGFNLNVTIPKEIGQHDLVAYAHSSVTGHETAVTVPVILGEDPSKVGVVPGTTSASNTNPGANPMPCTGSAASSAMTAPAMTAPTTSAPAAPAAVAAPAMNMAQPIALNVGNPSPGDNILSGAYVIMGTAWDARAQQGSGIDRLEFFLDARDDGGSQLTALTLAQPSPTQFAATVSLPVSRLGGHNLVVYAHSAISDTETSVSVPITVAH